MRFMVRQPWRPSVVALAVGLALYGVGGTQVAAQTSDAGMLTGEIARCVNGAEQPAASVNIGIDGGSATLARTDSGGQFVLALPPGMYTVIATASDGTATRQYVPVESGQQLDIGILDIGGSIAGCGPDSDITAPVLPTFVPTVAPTPAPTAETVAATPVPTAVPVATLVPTPEAPAEDPPGDPATGG